MNRVIHFEISAENPERAVSFYKQVFDWDIQKWAGPMDYWLVGTGDKKETGINGAIKHRVKANQGTVNSVHVASIDAALKKIVQAGGKIVMEKTPIPGLGFHAYCEDTEGNLFGLLEYLESGQNHM
jgi:uncharacterized protein